MSRNQARKDKVRRILDTIERVEITYDHVKEAWIDLYGVGYLPHNSFLSICIRLHDDWMPVGGLTSGKTSYKRRAIAASD
jgi:hypothetical protein